MIMRIVECQNMHSKYIFF